MNRRRKLLVLATALVALSTVACKPPSEPRPAYIRESRPPEEATVGELIFTSADSKTNERQLYETTGGRSQRVSSRRSEERSPAVSSDGRWIAYAVSDSEDADRNGIYVRSSADGEARPIARGAGSFDHPTWSPDASEIAYAHVGEEGSDWNIFVAERSGAGRPRAVVRDPGSDWYPAWSPDGSTIAYTSNSAGDDALWLYDVDSRRSRIAVDSKGEDIQPTWMPDSSRVVFTSDRELDRWQLFTYDLASEDEARLIRSTSMDRYPAVSPDGEHVAVSIGYLAIYRIDGSKFSNGVERWKLTDRLAITPAWLEDAEDVA